MHGCARAPQLSRSVRPQVLAMTIVRRIVVGLVVMMGVSLAPAGEWPESIADAMGLPHRTNGSLEVRIWVGGGISLPFHLYRIHSDHSIVSGEHFYWCDLPRSGSGKIMQDDARDERRWYAKQFCRNGMHETNGVIWCSSPLTGVDWSHLLKSIDVDKLWSLPPQASLGVAPCEIVDGVGVGIQLLEGQRYQSVVYWNPGQCCPWKECEVANKVLTTCEASR